MPADYDSPPPAAALLSAAGQPVRIYNEANWKRQFGESAQRSLDPVATAWLVRNSLLPMSESRWGFEGAIEQDVTELYLMPTTWFSRIFLGLRHAGRVDRIGLMLAMSGVSDFLDEKPVPPAAVMSPEQIRDISPVTITPLPWHRFYFADALVASRSPADFERQMQSATPFSPRVAFVPFPPFAPARGRVAAERQTANAIDLDVMADGPAFLVAAVTRDRYWRAAIDGHPVPLRPANVAYQGVIVPPGHHVVSMRYSNPVMSASAIISLISLIVIAVIAVGPDSVRATRGQS